MATPERCSLRELARRLGVKSDNVVRKAVASGRLKASVGYDEKGKPFIADVALAIREFGESASRARQETAAERAPACAPECAALERPAVRETATIISADTLAEAQRSVAIQRARKLQLENDLRTKVLIERSQAEKVAFEAERTIREAVLNIPARLSAELAAESDAVRLHIRLDAELRVALNMAADIIERAVNE